MSYNGNVKKEELIGRYCFWDIDGTLAPYRFNGHLGDPGGTQNGMSLREIEEGCCLEREPSRKMQHILKTCGAAEHVIVGHSHCEREREDKAVWCRRYFPDIREVRLIPDEVSKTDVIFQFLAERGLKPSDAVFIDDTLPILREAEWKGILAYHISSFLDWED